jgi:hypothetical protein
MANAVSFLLAIFIELAQSFFDFGDDLQDLNALMSHRVLWQRYMHDLTSPFILAVKTVVRLWRWEAEGTKAESMPVFNIKEGDRVKFLWTPNPAVAPPALPHNIARLEPCKCGPHNLHHVCV